MRIVLADDSTLFRTGLAMLLEKAGMTVVGQGRDGEQAYELVAAESPDVVILDIRMPPKLSDEGLLAADRIRRHFPTVGVLLLSTYADTPYAVRALGDGVGGIGYLLKDHVDDIEALTDAVVRVGSGRLVVDEEIISKLLSHRRRASELDKLTVRERMVLKHMAEGRSNLGIGQQMHLAAKTVENHIAGVFAKLGMPSSPDDNRRVLAVLAWLRVSTNSALD
jgi:DNA-binding NarL/FixJ family response regulator